MEKKLAEKDYIMETSGISESTETQKYLMEVQFWRN